MTVDPLQDLQIAVESYDVPRLTSVFGDTADNHWWTKAWFNNEENGKKAVEVSKDMALEFIHDHISKDAWMIHFFPKEMGNYYHALSRTRQQILGL